MNLSGVSRDEIARGDVLVPEGTSLTPSYRLDVQLNEDAQRLASDGERLQVHHGTRDAPARIVKIGHEGLAQLRLERPLIAMADERVVLRRIAPPETLGGARVVDPAPARHGSAAEGQLRQLSVGGIAQPTEVVAPEGAPVDSAPVIDRVALRVFALLRRQGPRPEGPQGIAGELGVDEPAVGQALRALIATGKVRSAGEGLYFDSDELAKLESAAELMLRDRGEIGVGELRDALGVSRRHALAVLGELASRGVSVRHGERHVMRGRR